MKTNESKLVDSYRRLAMQIDFSPAMFGGEVALDNSILPDQVAKSFIGFIDQMAGLHEAHATHDNNRRLAKYCYDVKTALLSNKLWKVI